jgi:hypothetical protein
MELGVENGRKREKPGAKCKKYGTRKTEVEEEKEKRILHVCDVRQFVLQMCAELQSTFYSPGNLNINMLFNYDVN